MKKVPLLIILACLLASTVMGQVVPVRKFKVSMGLTLIRPAYNLDYSAKTAGAADVALVYRLSPKWSASADVAVVALPGAKYFPASAVVPVRLGVRYFPLKNFYVAPKTGLGIYTIVKESDSYLTWGLSTGYFILPKFELGILYDGYSNRQSSFGYAGIRIAFQP